jgi:predicted ATP-dependent Lon-type protease
MPKMKVEFFTNHYGFVVDYLAEAVRELRKQTFTEVLDRHFSLGSHLKSRDVKAVRKTVSGLVKLIYPNGELSKDEVMELTELALEGRRRVKEQLKKMGSFEFHQTSFSLIDNETRDERFVGVPEQGGRDMIATDPLPREQQFAEKLHAYTLPRHGAANTRVRDLVDMVLLVKSGTLSNDKVAEAIRVTFDRRKTHALPNTLPVPPAEWQKPYQALARECGLSGEAKDAFHILQTFAEPIVGG